MRRSRTGRTGIPGTGSTIGRLRFCVALCLVFRDEGWVQQLAVKRSYRGRGLGGALLQAAFREFYRRGLKTAGLSTESRTGARGVYEHVGMKVTRSFKRYSKDL